LWQAQLWLRRASNADLPAYASTAARQGRLDSRYAAEIEKELSEAGLARSRCSALVEWVTPEATQAPGKRRRATATRRARPCAHPHYWAGFIYTGL
jgi:hypothetical protein